MILFAILFGVFGGAMTVKQTEYNKCEKAHFPLPICKCEKAMHESSLKK